MRSRKAGLSLTPLNGPLDSLLREALRQRRNLIEALHAEGTNCYRLFHGAVEGLPGLAVDRYGPVLLVQTWSRELEPGQLDEIDRVYRAYPDLNDDDFVQKHRSDWLSG